ncbi:MAG: tRNA(m(1)G37)methyltransferase [Stictis urceolatum]|nr:tRNA(m(1)G37)methyltransferase [Stictis urceolata]
MRVLDRSFFKKTVALAVAQVHENNQIAPCRMALGQEVLKVDRVPSVRELASDQKPNSSGKALLLHPGIRAADSSTWSDKLRALVEEDKVAVSTYELQLDYDHWDYIDIMNAVLPEEAQEELPTGFNVAGHVAHLNLRDRFLPYKHIIAAVLMDKNPAIRTVINKVDSVGKQSEYRTFEYEVLAGEPSLDVEVKEQNCIFRFDYAKVYWNSKLNTEHERLVNLFSPGEAVCDVMAGVGPFAVPAGKRHVFVWANDLNPAGYRSLSDAIIRNNVSAFVKPFNEDGRDFIRRTAQAIQAAETSVDVTPKPKRVSRSSPRPESPTRSRKVLKQPKTFDHYVMNLPATATTFLDAFVGLYRGGEKIFAPHTDRKLPMVHVHCFSTKSDDNKRETMEICEEISQQLRYPFTLETPDFHIWDVRDVGPKKRMFCASLRLPADVAFR